MTQDDPKTEPIDEEATEPNTDEEPELQEPSAGGDTPDAGSEAADAPTAETVAPGADPEED